MKHFSTISTLIILFALCSCSQKTLYYAKTNVIDYSIYAKEGFFISEANSVSFNYTPIGSVSTIVLSGHLDSVKRELTSKNFDLIDTMGNLDENYDLKWRNANVNDAIRLSIEKVKLMGGNGIINLKIQPYYQNEQSGYLVTGMAISK